MLARPVTIIAEISSRGHLPLVVGGTGFYLRGLLEGLPALPGRDEPLRERLASGNSAVLERSTGCCGGWSRRLPLAFILAMCRRQRGPWKFVCSPARRCRRPLRRNPWKASGCSRSAGARSGAAGGGDCCPHSAKCLQAGLVEEVRGLLDQGLSGEEKPFESLGYKQVLAHLRGQMSLEQAMASTEIETRQYAKRQLTWFRGARKTTPGSCGFPDSGPIHQSRRRHWTPSASSCRHDRLGLLQGTPSIRRWNST